MNLPQCFDRRQKWLIPGQRHPHGPFAATRAARGPAQIGAGDIAVELLHQGGQLFRHAVPSLHRQINIRPVDNPAGNGSFVGSVFPAPGLRLPSRGCARASRLST